MLASHLSYETKHRFPNVSFSIKSYSVKCFLLTWKFRFETSATEGYVLVVFQNISYMVSDNSAV